jgi:hypothetical protein
MAGVPTILPAVKKIMGVRGGGSALLLPPTTPRLTHLSSGMASSYFARAAASFSFSCPARIIASCASVASWLYASIFPFASASAAVGEGLTIVPKPL